LQKFVEKIFRDNIVLGFGPDNNKGRFNAKEKVLSGKTPENTS